MENKEIKINKDTLLEAYANGDEKEKNLLERLYGKEAFQLNVMDRVKTFYDAINELGEDHPLVKTYHSCYDEIINEYKDIVAFFKLRIITAALNEGWKPTFAKDEQRYYPYFHFYTQEQIDAMSENERANVLFFARPIDFIMGFASAGSHNNASLVANIGLLILCFKTRELADYAGKQFIDYYADYFGK